MKLYTKRGDDGGTDLFGGRRVTKDSPRIEAVGTVDELNSVVGLAAVVCHDAEMAAMLHGIQQRLFELGADLANPPAAGEKETGAKPMPRISAHRVTEAEQNIDRICDLLPSLKHFILPGGCELAARLHLARSVCRRAERCCIVLGRHEPVGEHATIFLNRLSDLLFALARRANQIEGAEDVVWKENG